MKRLRELSHAATPPLASPDPLLPWCKAGVILGYALMFGGALSMFSIPIWITISFFLLGRLLQSLAQARRPELALPNPSFLAGSIIASAVWISFGHERKQAWPLHPVSWFFSGMVLLIATLHWRHYYSLQRQSPPPTAPLPTA